MKLPEVLQDAINGSDSKQSLLPRVNVRGRRSVSIWLGYILVVSVLDKEVDQITLEDLKVMVMDKVKENKRKWLSLGPVNVIQDFVDEAKTYKELISIFR